MSKLTEQLVIKLLSTTSTFRSRYELLVPNCFISQHGDIEADLFAIRHSGFADEFEVKLTRADFMADRKKLMRVRPLLPEEYMLPRDQINQNAGCVTKEEAHRQGLLPVNYFWYVVKAGIVTVDDLPDYAGLIEVTDGGYIRVIRSAKRLKPRKLDDSERYKFALKLHYRFWDYIHGRRKEKERDTNDRAKPENERAFEHHSEDH